MSNFPCLRAEILGGAYVHEGWADTHGGRLVGLFDSDWNARLFAQMLAAKESVDSSRHWIVTNSHDGDQQRWDRKRVDEESARTAQTGADHG